MNLCGSVTNARRAFPDPNRLLGANVKKKMMAKKKMKAGAGKPMSEMQGNFARGAAMSMGGKNPKSTKASMKGC